MVRHTIERITDPIRGFQKVAYSRFSAPIRGLHQAAYLLAGLTLASQILALLRDRAFAHSFGAGMTLDLYYSAFRVPDLVFALVSSLVSAYVLIPLISGAPSEKIRHILGESATFLVGAGGVLCIVIGIFMPDFLRFLYPNLMASSEQSAFVFLARLLLMQPILLGLSGIFGSVTQLHRQFALFALSPVLYNLGIIFGTIFLYPHYGLLGIGMGVILGSVAYLSVNIPVLIKRKVWPSFTVPTWRGMLPIVTNSVPRSLALGMGSVTALFLTAMASRVGNGAVSVFTFAGNLEAVPLALIGSSYAVAAFPALSEASAKHDTESFSRVLTTSARHIILWSIVGLGLVVVLRAHLVRVILGTGAFNWNDTRLTSALLAILAVGLTAQGLVLLFSRALYAARQSWRPLAYQVIGGVLTMVLAFVFIGHQNDAFAQTVATVFRVSDVPGYSILLLAVATTLGQIFLALLSLLAVVKVSKHLARSLLSPVIDGVISALAGGISAYAVLFLEGGFAPLTTLFSVFTQGLIAGIVGLCASAGTLYVIENEEFRSVVTALSRLLARRKTDMPVVETISEETIK